jgi:anaerobic magnesium-protoporphyrin IX monomethyl ester cyclase
MNVLLVTVQGNLDATSLEQLHYQLMKNGHDSTLLYLPYYDPGNETCNRGILEFVEELKPELIGLSLMSIEYAKSRELTLLLKGFRPDATIVWGGIHPTISPQTCVEYADYVCVGEGERTIVELADAMRDGGPVRSIKNLCYLDGGRMVRNPLHPLLDDLDSQPESDHVPKNSHLQDRDGRIVQVDEGVYRKHARWRGTVYSTMTSRGCPFSCTYCCNNSFSKLYESWRVRRRSVEGIISSMESAVKANAYIEYINITDDCFLACDDGYLREFCREYKRRVGKPFVVRSIPNYVSLERMRLLKDAGVSLICMGLQSGSDRVLKDVYKRKSLRNDFLRAARVIRSVSIAPIYDIIVDNPFETDEERLQTVEALIETPTPFYLQVFSLTFYAGTEIYERGKVECPERIGRYTEKDFAVYRKDSINRMIIMAAFMPGPLGRTLVRMYRRSPHSLRTKAALAGARILTKALFEPLNYLMLFKSSTGGSYATMIGVMPRHVNNYFSDAFYRYARQSRPGMDG